MMLSYRPVRVFAALVASTLAVGSPAQKVDVGSGSIVQKVLTLRPGEYIWVPELAPDGPTLLIVNTTTQRAVLYRNGIPIAASTVSTGRPGYRTPTGVFTILQKRVEHYSSKYDNAPMPYMQRLTWRGVALHAGQLPGYPASHGCIRLPKGFAPLLYRATSVGMTVVVTDLATTPRIAPTPEIALGRSEPTQAPGQAIVWQPDKAPSGPVSIIVSAADGRAIVLRNGIEIGSGPVSIEGPVTGTWAYALRSIDREGQHWLRLQLAEGTSGAPVVSSAEWRQFRAPDEFRRAVAGVIRPGTTIIVTADSLKAGVPIGSETVMEAEQPEAPAGR